MEIFLSNIPYGANQQVVEDLFKQYGVVEKVYLPYDKVYKRTRGYGFITMPNEEEAWNAINALNETTFDRRILKVTKSVKPVDQGELKFLVNSVPVKKETFERILGRQLSKEEADDGFEENISANMKINKREKENCNGQEEK